ncbi:DUF2061 domain-containing protein [Bradyrhizobium sp. STM 3557]|uniref:DUF2061 domain-containing protein n=1 Tax=Bradyrhizobium sp. STM 3557 TaxID=578920 RepID=UPI00388EFF99
MSEDSVATEPELGERTRPAPKVEQVSRGGPGVNALQRAESHTRSVLKAISWRTLGTVDTFLISWFLTGRLTLAGSIAGLEFATKIACTCTSGSGR